MFLILTLFFPHLNQRATGVLKSPSLASLTSLRSGEGLGWGQSRERAIQNANRACSPPPLRKLG